MPSDRWRRFTILDASILVASAAVGLALVRAWPGSDHEWLWGRYQTAVFLFSALAVGSVLASGPTLLIQRRLRSRTEPLTLGEIFWGLSAALWIVVPILCWILIPVIGNLALLLVTGLIGLQGLIALIAAGQLLDAVFDRSRRVPSAWTNRFGQVACVLSGIYAVGILGTAFSQL